MLLSYFVVTAKYLLSESSQGKTNRNSLKFLEHIFPRFSKKSLYSRINQMQHALVIRIASCNMI